MVDIHHHGLAEAPLSVAFAYLDDYRTATTWMFGLSEFEPVDAAKIQGIGAQFNGTFAVKPIKLSSRVEITEWEQDALIALTSIKGFKNSSTWRFSADGPTRTTLDVVFSYDLPGGLAGKALGRVIEPVVSLSVRKSDEALRKGIEAAHRASNT